MDIPAVNPARAGMILTPEEHEMPTTGKPRASGDDPPREGMEIGVEE